MRTSLQHQSEAQPPNGPLTAPTSPDTPSTCPAKQFPLCGATPARENWRQRGCAPSVRRLFCAVGAIAGISQTWDNEPSLIESIVDGRSPKTNIGMKPAHPLHSLLSGNQTDKTDLLCSAFLDTINGGGGCITGRQHRRHDDHEPLRKVGRSFEKIFDCNECIGITVKPDMRDTCSRHEIEHAFHECHAGPKNWRKNKLLSSDSRR